MTVVKPNTWLSARAIQAAGKQASGIVRGTKKKQEQRRLVYNRLMQSGQIKQALRLKKTIDNASITKPSVQNICPELDSRFVKVNINASGHFDAWLELQSLGSKLRIKIPFRRTKHLNSLIQSGKLLGGCRLSRDFVALNFDLPDPIKMQSGSTLGIDIGMNKAFVCSDSQAAAADVHGHTLQSICKKLARKRLGSKAFAAAQQHRTNYVNWSLNKLNFNGVQTIAIENIKHLRRGRKTSRYLSHFTYTEIFRKIEDRAARSGVQIATVDPQFTSQRCSCCGWVRKANRKGEQFVCTACGFAADADLNAAINIRSQLAELPPLARRLKLGRSGFYWAKVGGVPIVPLAKKQFAE
jgi:IS605 OrfB family transposase